jgi:hypothetical protein
MAAGEHEAAEHHAEKARPLEQRFKVKCTPDYDAVLEDPAVDFVSIATDFYLKRPLILKAIACGKRDTAFKSYFIAHKDAAAAQKSWDAFRADPAWQAAKKASEAVAGGSLTVQDGVKSVFLKPTDFSPLK